MNVICRLPDPVFHQEVKTESELDEDWVAGLATDMRGHTRIFDAMYVQEISMSRRNPNIDDEAIEQVKSEPEEVPQQKTRHVEPRLW